MEIKELIINNKKYVNLIQIGYGALGKVYKGQYENQFYAIKKQEFFQEGELFYYQSLVKNQCRCRNLIKIYDFEKIGRYSFIVMELAESSLYDELENNTIDKTNLRYMMQQIGYGIKELHSMGIAHRDLKPENILVITLKSHKTYEQQKIYKICDFGTAKCYDKLKTKGVGTPYYLAPEMLSKNCNTYNKKCDIWSFGQLIYEIITGSLMFQGRILEDIEKQILNATDEQIQEKINKLPILQEYKELIKKMLIINCEKRIDIEEVLDSLKPRSRSTSRNKQEGNQTNDTPQISIRGMFNNHNQQNSRQNSPFILKRENQITSPFMQSFANQQVNSQYNFNQNNIKQVQNYKQLNF